MSLELIFEAKSSPFNGSTGLITVCNTPFWEEQVYLFLSKLPCHNPVPPGIENEDPNWYPIAGALDKELDVTVAEEKTGNVLLVEVLVILDNTEDKTDFNEPRLSAKYAFSVPPL